MSRPLFTHELRGLPENEAWSLFRQVAFKHGQVPNPSHEAIGREIVEKCCGVPLAIKTIGGMLYFKDLESEWVLFKDKELSKIDVYKNDILPILILSYNHLPSHYKHCFAYCSLYPKDFDIPVEEMIHLWKAQGYVKSTNSNECLQDIGYGYFMDLFRLSFFQDVECDDFGNKYCKMHDLMHDLAISVAGDSFCVSHSGTTSIKDKTQHMSFWVQQNTISHDFSSLLKSKKVRTILPFTACGTSIGKEELDAVFCNLTRLRVLNLSEFSINTLPSSIYKLKHLRYLDFSENEEVQKLPDSITDLQNLLVLKLRWCVKLLQLPNNMKKLVNLTELDNHACFKSTHMPRGIGQLTRLERLSTFVIAKDSSVSKNIGGLDELRTLNNLRGQLEIRNLRYMKNVASEFQAAHLNAKHLLHKLTLEWSNHEDNTNNFSENDVAIDEMGLEALQPHQNLKELWVVYYRGVKPPSWLPLITNLVSVHFENCSSIKWLPPLDRLPCLAKLSLWDLTNLERIDIENGGSSSSSFFPCLTDLTLRDCPNLKGFVRRNTDIVMECFPCLSTLAIGGCPSLTYLPLFSELKKLILEKGGIKSLMEVLKMTTSESSSSPFYTLSKLQNLEICEKYFPEDELLQYIPSLQHLKFYYCPFQSLASDDKDDGRQWQSLEVLRSVQFCRMRNLVSLPKGLRYVTTLQSLDILHCPSLVSIPQWMNSLVGLQDLTISGCPELSERCKSNVAEDWPNIFHVPNVYIEGKTVQRNGCYLL